MKAPDEPYYREEIVRPAPLPAKDEFAMFADYQKRRTARKRDRIVRQYLYWAAELACRYCGPRMPKRDAISAANLGLMQAIEDFDPARGRRFVTHSYFAIRRTVLTALRETYIVDPSPGINPHWHKFNKSARTADDQKKFTMAKKDVFDSLGSTVEFNSISKHSHGGAGGGNAPWNDNPDADLSAPDERPEIEDASMLDALREKLVILTPQEREIITRRYFGADTPLFREIGDALDLDEDHVRYVHKRALERLKHSLRGEL